MRALGVTFVAVALLLPRPATACAIKDNDVAIVVGTVGAEVATLRIALHQQERDADMIDTEWSGAATLVIGATTQQIGSIDPKLDPSLEIDRLATLARARAQGLPGFVAAAQVGETDCTTLPGKRCGGASLKGSKLKLGAVQVDAGSSGLAITGVVRYRAGGTEIAVVNVGVGSPKFSTSVRPCSAGVCRTITTLHHGEQRDLVVVTRRGT